MSSIVPSEDRQFLGEKILGSWESLPSMATSEAATPLLEDGTPVEPDGISEGNGLDGEHDQVNGLDEELKSVSAQKTKKKVKRSTKTDSPGTEVEVERRAKKRKPRS